MGKSYILKIPDKYRDRYLEEQVEHNFTRLMISGAIILGIQFIAVFTNMMNPFTTHYEIITHYFKFYQYTISANIVLLLLGHILSVKGAGIKIRRSYIYLYAYFQVLWGAGVALADQFQGEQIVVYYTLLFIFAIILDLETSSFLLIVAINHVTFFLLLTIYERFYTTVFGLRAGSTQIVSFIVLLRYYLHELLKKNFVQREDLKEKNLELEFYANYDSLTKVFNRRRWEQSFKDSFIESVSEQKALGLVMIDIDSFKDYNDNYGHIKGDVVLESFGEVLNKTALEYDGIPGRFGGDEFVVLFPEIDKMTMEFFVIAMEKHISDLDIEHLYSKTSKRLTISCGSHFAVPGYDETMWHFAAEADESLYIAKANKKKDS